MQQGFDLPSIQEKRIVQRYETKNTAINIIAIN